VDDEQGPIAQGSETRSHSPVLLMLHGLVQRLQDQEQRLFCLADVTAVLAFVSSSSKLSLSL
jgi:hypothetical protein